MRSRRSPIILAAVALSLVPAAHALGALGTWQFPPTDLSPYGDLAAEPLVVVNPAGDATAIWRNSGGGAPSLVRERLWTAGAWSAETALSAPPENAFALALAANASGVAAAVWTRSDGANARVQVASRVGGAWGTPYTVSDPGHETQHPAVAVDASGVTTVAWLNDDGGQDVVQWSRNAGGTWSAPVDLSLSGASAQNVSLIVDSSGVVTAMWSRGISMQASRFSGSWGPTVNLDSLIASAPHLAVDPSGVVTAVWSSYVGGVNVVRSARTSGGGWGPIVTISTAGQDSSLGGVASDASGAITAIWRTFIGTDWVIQAARFVDGTWSSPVALAEPSPAAYNPTVAAGPAGSALALWQRSDGTNLRVQAAEFAGGAWEAPITLSPSGTDADTSPMQVAMGPTGAATAVWGLSAPANNVQAIRYVVPPAPASASGGATPQGTSPQAQKARTEISGKFVLNRRTRVGTTTGTVPAGVTRITQSARAAATRKVRARNTTGTCRIDRGTYRCTILLARGAWNISTVGSGQTGVVARSARRVVVPAMPRPVAVVG